MPDSNDPQTGSAAGADAPANANTNQTGGAPPPDANTTANAGAGTATNAGANAGTNGGAGHGGAGNGAAGGEPAFEFEGDNDRDDKFNLRPLPDRHSPIPEDQRKVAHDVYEARNVLKLLLENNAIAQDKYEEFIKRVCQAGRAGCVASYVHPILGATALEQIRADIVRRVGMPMVYKYLRTLGVWAFVRLLAGAAASALVGWLAYQLGHPATQVLIGYDWMLAGSMAGAWFSVAASRWQVGFDTIPLYLDWWYEPAIRMMFVVVGTALFALFLHLNFLAMEVGNVDFSHFDSSLGTALFAGLIAGIGERALSVQLIGRLQKAFPGT
ncbi:MAG TPA: hypothetical protein VL048_07665 [Xanthobacteraceae bacterium]|nr:hypothetical protein [Xanthobacteraceae bacterium]